ncbi:hypothetical protein DA2_3768 [Desulfovibrio sp. A2]|nr:hypothetical protein DA2_3768 [Desulfovibrio sp. A2]
MRTADLTPTWGEWGNLFYRFALEGNRQSLETLHPDMAKAFAAAAAFVAIQPSLTEEQRLQANGVLEAEIRKQGVA